MCPYYIVAKTKYHISLGTLKNAGGRELAVADETAYLAISLGVHRSKKVSGGIKKKRHCLLHTACIFSSVRRDDEALQNVMHI